MYNLAGAGDRWTLPRQHSAVNPCAVYGLWESFTPSREDHALEPSIVVAHGATALLRSSVDHSLHSPSRGTLLGVRKLFLRLLVGVRTAVGSLRPARRDSNLSTVIVSCAAGRTETGLLAGGAGVGVAAAFGGGVHMRRDSPPRERAKKSAPCSSPTAYMPSST